MKKEDTKDIRIHAEIFGDRGYVEALYDIIKYLETK